MDAALVIHVGEEDLGVPHSGQGVTHVPPAQPLHSHHLPRQVSTSSHAPLEHPLDPHVAGHPLRPHHVTTDHAASTRQTLNATRKHQVGHILSFIQGQAVRAD